jgi:hypothetical protein
MPRAAHTSVANRFIATPLTSDPEFVPVLPKGEFPKGPCEKGNVPGKGVIPRWE